MSTATYTKSGAKASSPAKLDKAIFSVEVLNHDLLKKSYLSYLANGRINLAVAKRRGEVRGGGRKPIRQKGTGYARVGSTRNPLRRGGGVAFGPTGNENFKISLNSHEKMRALKQALTLASKAGKVIVIEDFAIPSGKTKDALTLFKKINASGQVLLVTGDRTEPVMNAVGNLQKTKAVQAGYLNTFDILNADQLVITKAALTALKERLIR